MGKNKKKSSSLGLMSNGFEHGRAQHDVVELWNGVIQPTCANELRKEALSYDLCVFLADSYLPDGMPISFNYAIPPIKDAPKMLMFFIPDRHAPKEGPMLEWFLMTLRKELQKPVKIGMACIGGHGRTGTILATLWGLANQSPGGGLAENPIIAIRDIVGCEREVESREQEEFVYKMTGFVPPKEFLIKKYEPTSYSYGYGAGSGESSFEYWDESGKGVNPLDFEPSMYKGTIFEKGKFAFAYIVTKDLNGREWALPLKTNDLNQIPEKSRYPLFICHRCSCGNGFEMPLHKGSHMKCIVCPLLEEKKISRTRPIIKTTTSRATSCDHCKKSFEGKYSTIWMFIDSIPYDYCSEACKWTHYKIMKPNATLPLSAKGAIIPFKSKSTQDWPCDRVGCLRIDARIDKIVGDMTFHFCSMGCLASVMEKVTPKGGIA